MNGFAACGRAGRPARQACGGAVMEYTKESSQYGHADAQLSQTDIGSYKDSVKQGHSDVPPGLPKANLLT